MPVVRVTSGRREEGEAGGVSRSRRGETRGHACLAWVSSTTCARAAPGGAQACESARGREPERESAARGLCLSLVPDALVLGNYRIKLGARTWSAAEAAREPRQQEVSARAGSVAPSHTDTDRRLDLEAEFP
ncbi:hypothetical protein NDU88_001434 [Pleurodeles waltl]|uniref:Uncharacterized protein n=1 Tax=Pleurodeles waltl TaxID=8319 RepID=A0AAV7UWT0_PLEWA|nr:hypothetical protein NDU88_001434 [Pleurodeles waltl]